MKKDLVIGIVGTLILLTAMVGVFRYEAAQRGSSFDVTWETREVSLAAEDGATNEQESTALSVNVTQLNVTRIEFRLEWTDSTANSGPDEFELTVTAPGGAPKTARSSEGVVSVVFENVSGVPTDVRLLGSDEVAVRQQALSYASTAGTGAWNVTVTLVDAGDISGVPGQAPIPAQLQDVSNEWTLTPVATVFEARFTAA
jgi:hypothetical protein